MIAIVNARLVLEDRVLDRGALLIEEGRILALGEEGSFPLPPCAEILDAKGQYVGPGFVDIHCHGGGGHLLYEEPEEGAAHFLATGTTTVLAAFYTDMNGEEMLTAIERIRKAMQKDGAGKALGGIYMEGPYLNPTYGASPEKHQWRGPVLAAEYEPIVTALGDLVKVWALSPEREGLLPFAMRAREVNPTVMLSVAHSEATPDQVAVFKPYGMNLQTHCMNATGRLPAPRGTRSCGPDEACLTDRDMYAEVIADSQGIHVHADMLRMILAVKGVDKVVLISDSFLSDEPNPPEFADVVDLNFDRIGGLCGSKLTLNIACRNMRKHTGASIPEVFLMASRNPARVIDIEDTVGTLAVGKKANLVIVDEDFHVERVILEGRPL